jgi:hypothetical protein
MRLLLRAAILLSPLTFLLSGQTWEFGGSAGYGVSRDVTATTGAVSASAGFQSGFAFGGVLGNQINRWVGGEARYTFLTDDLRVSSGSTKATLGAHSHAIHYDVLLHAASRESKIRPFIAAGAGVKLYRGTGTEQAFQPLSNIVVLTHTNEAQPLVSVGGGVKFAVSRKALVRLDFRDYATPLPSSLLAVPPNAKISGWMHDFVFMIGVSGIN